MRRAAPGSGLLLLALLAGGCTNSPDNGGAGAIRLVPVTYARWQEKLAQYKGDIVVVDMWATWCAPCVERFPHMVDLSRKYSGDKGIRFVSISLDDHNDPQAVKQAEEFLIKQNATIDNYIMDEIVPDAFEKLDLLGIPAVYIYDRDGTRKYRLTGDDPNHQFTNEDVDRAIQELLEDSARSDQPAQRGAAAVMARR